jgi:hypothetical protein
VGWQAVQVGLFPKPGWLFAQSPDSLGILDRPATSAYSLASCCARSPSADSHRSPAGTVFPRGLRHPGVGNDKRCVPYCNSRYPIGSPVRTMVMASVLAAPLGSRSMLTPEPCPALDQSIVVDRVVGNSIPDATSGIQTSLVRTSAALGAWWSGAYRDSRRQRVRRTRSRGGPREAA